jgi:hypothetical protein
VGEVIRAQTAVVWARAFLNHYVRGVSAFAVCPISAKFLVHFIRTKVELLTFAVRGAGLAHIDAAVALKDLGIKYHVAVRTDALSKPNSGFLAQ